MIVDRARDRARRRGAGPARVHRAGRGRPRRIRGTAHVPQPRGGRRRRSLGPGRARGAHASPMRSTRPHARCGGARTCWSPSWRPGPPAVGQLLALLAARGARRPRARDPGPEPHHAAAGGDGRGRARGRHDALLRLDPHRGRRQLHRRRADRARAARDRHPGRDVGRADRGARRRDAGRAVGAAQPAHRSRPAPLGRDLARPDRSGCCWPASPAWRSRRPDAAAAGRCCSRRCGSRACCC